MPKPSVVAVRVAAEHRRRVGADAEEERVAEGHLPGVPGDQAEPDGADRGDAAGGRAGAAGRPASRNGSSSATTSSDAER